MKKYTAVEISEKQLEEMIRQVPNFIEEGLRYVGHQQRTNRGPLDVLFVDSGNALVVAELKVIEDDGMLVQSIDYYDYITTNVEGFARAYKDKKIDSTQKPRLFLIAPNFSVSLLNRCKWVDIPISLFTFQCIAFEENPKEIVPIFKEMTFPSRFQPVEVHTIKKRLDYITDEKVRKIIEGLIEEIKEWDKERIAIDAIKNDISIKVSGKVFSYLGPRRNHFIVSTYDKEGNWRNFPINQADDLEDAKLLLKGNYEKMK